MTMNKLIILSFLLFFSTIFSFKISCLETNIQNNSYEINPKIKAIIESKIDSSIKSKLEENKNNQIPFDKLKKLISLNGFGTMDFKIYQDDSIIADTYKEGKSMDCIIMAYLEGDTVNLSGYFGLTAGFGFAIALFADTCIVQHFAHTDASIYRLKKTDSLAWNVSVPCKTYKLTLGEKSKNKKGDIIYGKVELLSDNYYEKDNNNPEKKYSMQITGYFKTRPLLHLGDKDIEREEFMEHLFDQEKKK